MAIETMRHPLTLIADTASRAPWTDGWPISGDDIAVATRLPLGSAAARAVGRFNPEGPTGYRAATAPDAPLRPSRSAARADERLHREGRRIERARFDLRRRAEKTIQRAERHTERFDGEVHYSLGSTVRTVTA
jgi:hypothetical protein